MRKPIHDAVIWQGRRYTAEYTDADRKRFDVPCASYGTRRCAIGQPHSSLVHLVIGLAEQSGNVEVAS